MEVTVITPTIGTKSLEDAIRSVRSQSVRCQHLLVVDGEQYWDAVAKSVNKYGADVKMIVLPENTGQDYMGAKWNGHRIYSAIPRLVNTRYVSFLDEDNWYEPNFIEVMLNKIGKNMIATCRRKVWGDGYIGVDNFESIGKNGLGYTLYDTNTMFFDANSYSKYLSTYFYYPLQADRKVSKIIDDFCSKDHIHIHNPLVNYRAPERLWNFFKNHSTTIAD